jgi:NAD(P)H-dependent FMN reductase
VKILAISGSLRAGSYNTALARAAAELAPDGVEIEVYDGLGLVPHYDEDLDQEGIETPATVAELRRRIDEADALLLVTPEYNG